jgi:NAD(P)-dependent dehydrogenase (short-subunit alcohol dehydrogenase family)
MAAAPDPAGGRLHGRVVAITGAGGGIGAACAERYCRDGASVVCVDIADSVHDLAERLRGQGRAVTGLTADISTEEGNALVVDTAREAYGGLDVFHANAAAQVMARAEQTTAADWELLEKTNLRGVFLGARAAIPALRERGGGSIIFTASILSIVGDADLAAYGAMKGGVRSLARSLTAAHGPENIRVNTICPGDVDTPMVQEYFDFQPDPEAAKRVVTDRYPLRRFARPEDVAGVAAFLASDDAAYLSGIDLVVDGGLLAQVY